VRKQLLNSKIISIITLEMISTIPIPKIHSLVTNTLKALTIKIFKLDREKRNVKLKLELQDQDKNSHMTDLKTMLLMVRNEC